MAPIDITATPEWAALAGHHAAVRRRHLKYLPRAAADGKMRGMVAAAASLR